MTTDNRADVNLELLTWLPLDAKRVLEIGYENSALATAYKAKNPVAEYVVEEIREFSATRWIDVKGDQTKDAANLYDLVVINNVLHKLDDPRLVLERLHQTISESAHLAICVPNATHWSAIVQLLGGSLPTQPEGEGGRDQRQFFTLESLTKILRDCGFELLKARPRNGIVDREKAERAVPALAEMADRFGLDRRSFLGRVNALQYVVVAKRAASRDQKRMLRVHISAMAPRFLDVRTRLPAEGLNSLSDIYVTTAERSLSLPNYDVTTPKICVLQRLALSDVAAYLSWVRDRIREGWMIVAESDDHPELLAAVHGRNLDDAAWLPISAAHAVQTSTTALSEAYRVYNPEVAIFPNAVFSLPPFVKRTAPIRIFFGALNRENITGRVASSLGKFCKDYPDANFVVVHDKVFFDNLETTSKVFHPACDYNKYLDLLGSCDVALMPLEGTIGEIFKSDVKFLEASSRGVVSIASPTVYEHSIKDGDTGLIARSNSDWAILLGKCAESDDFRARLAYNAWTYVRQNRMFAEQIGARREWYNHIWSRRNELTKLLVDRHPGLVMG